MHLYAYFLSGTVMFAAFHLVFERPGLRLVPNESLEGTRKWRNSAIACGVFCIILWLLKNSWGVGNLVYVCLGCVIGLVTEPRIVLHKSIVQLFPVLAVVRPFNCISLTADISYLYIHASTPLVFSAKLGLVCSCVHRHTEAAVGAGTLSWHDRWDGCGPLLCLVLHKSKLMRQESLR